MTLDDAIRAVPEFDNWNFADKIRFFCWYLETYGGLDSLQPTDVDKCFDKLRLAKPKAIGPFFQSMENKKPKQLVRSGKGYALENRVKKEYDEKYGQRESTVAVDKMLAELPAKIPGVNEQAYLGEALICFRNKAFRAAIIMAWNLAYDHFLRWILNDPTRLGKFNAQLPVSFPKADVKVINTLDDFSFLKEYHVLTIAKKANLISVSLHKVLQEKLDRRNIAAHPSGIVVHQVTAEDFIKDLVENVVLRLT